MIGSYHHQKLYNFNILNANISLSEQSVLLWAHLLKYQHFKTLLLHQDLPVHWSNNFSVYPKPVFHLLPCLFSLDDTLHHYNHTITGVGKHHPFPCPLSSSTMPTWKHPMLDTKQPFSFLGLHPKQLNTAREIQRKKPGRTVSLLVHVCTWQIEPQLPSNSTSFYSKFDFQSSMIVLSHVHLSPQISHSLSVSDVNLVSDLTMLTYHYITRPTTLPCAYMGYKFLCFN